MKLKAIAGLLALTVAALGGYWYYSPHLALKALHLLARRALLGGIGAGGLRGRP